MRFDWKEGTYGFGQHKGIMLYKDHKVIASIIEINGKFRAHTDGFYKIYKDQETAKNMLEYHMNEANDTPTKFVFRTILQLGGVLAALALVLERVFNG
jgi:hypothetical protein